MVKSCLEIQMEIYERGKDQSRRFPVSFEDWEEEAKKILAAGPISMGLL